MSSKCSFSSLSPWLWPPSVMVFTLDWKGVRSYWAPNQLRLGHCCSATASCKAPPPLARVAPVLAIPVTHTSWHGLQQLKGISIINSTPGSFWLNIGCMSSEPYLWADFDYQEDWAKRKKKKRKSKKGRKRRQLFCLNTMQKKVFGDEEPMLTADEWIHRQYEIDLNFLSLGGYNPVILTAKAKRSVCEDQHSSRWEPQCYLLLEKWMRMSRRWKKF